MATRGSDSSSRLPGSEDGPDDRAFTLAAVHRDEPDPIKNSRHLAAASPIQDEDAAMEFVRSLRAEHSHANHHAFAYRLAPDGSLHRASDDGEPGGTAGRPILRQLEAFRIVDTVVVVTRYFGGTKLGAGGLVRAYGGAARAVLSSASLVEVIDRERLSVGCDYADEAAVRSVLIEHDAQDLAADHGHRVRLTAAIAKRDREHFIEALALATRGRAVVDVVS